jgi:hypothetical protein
MSADKRWQSKEAAAIARAAEQAGGLVERTRNGHMKVTGPAGVAFVATKLGGSGGRTLTSTLATIAREAGLTLTLRKRPG